MLGLPPLLVDEDLQAQEQPSEAANAMVLATFGFLSAFDQTFPRATRKPVLLHSPHQKNAVECIFWRAENHIGCSQIMAYISYKTHWQKTLISPAHSGSGRSKKCLGGYTKIMERRQHSRIPVELNAVLIGEKTVPKGCKVNNISQQGLLLTCVADGRVSTFQKGNIVNVHLLFQQSGGCKYLTKTADVKHADENSIGVEFQQPDSKLLEFLKHCNTDSKHDLDTASEDISASVSEGIDMHKATNADILDEVPGASTVTKTREPDMPVAKDRMVFYAGLAFLVIAAGLALGAYLYTSKINNRISVLETVTEKHTSELTEVQEWALPASMLEGKFAYLNAQMKALIDSFAKLENRLTAGSAQPPVKIVALADTPAAETGSEEATASPARTKAVMPPAAGTEKTAVDTSREIAAAEHPAAGAEMTAVDTIRRTTAAEPPAAVTEKTAIDTSQKTAAAEPPAAKTRAAVGPWVINLSSSPDKAAADRFTTRARSKGIPVELVKAEVKGRDFWRVQLTGFVSKDAASTYAGPVKEKLGLKDVWIFTQ